MERRSNSLRDERQSQKNSAPSSLGANKKRATVSIFTLKSLLIVVSVVALAGAAQLYADGQSLRSDLQTSEKARAALETDAKAASDRVFKAESTRAAAEASLAEARNGKKAAELSLKQTREWLATADHARTITESRLKAVTDELAQLQSAKKDLEAAAANTERDLERERAATQAAEQALHASAAPHEMTAPPETTGSLATSIPPTSKLDALFVSNPNRSNAVPTAPISSTGATRGTRMEECMAIWEPATHMTKREWRRTCKDTLSEDF